MKKENNGRTAVLPVILCVAALVLIIAYAFGTIGKGGASKTQTAVHEDDGFWKTKEQLENDKNITLYIQEAVLGSSERTKKLEVFVQEVSDVTKLEDKGVLPFDLDKKTMYIKYSGTATYTVDLSQLTDADVTVNQGNKIVTICIPHVEEKLELNTDDTDSDSPWSQFISKINGGSQALLNKVENLLSDFIDVVAIYMVTTCVIPVLVFIVMVWLIKILFHLRIMQTFD